MEKRDEKGRFLKGNKRPQYIIEKIKTFHILNPRAKDKNPFFGKHHSLKTIVFLRKIKKGLISPNKGKKTSLEIREKISKAMKGVPSPLKGIKLSLNHRKKLSLSRTGIKNPRWKGGGC